MTIDWMTILTNTGKVLVVGLLLGAGLPFLFSLGINMWDQGEGGQHADGTISARKPGQLAIAYVLFAAMALTVLTGLLYLMRSSVSHYLGITIF